MKLQFTTTEVVTFEKELPCPYYVEHCFILFKIENDTAIEVEPGKYLDYTGIKVHTKHSDAIARAVKNGKEIPAEVFEAAYNKVLSNINSLPESTLVEALKHLKEMTYTACTIEGKAYGARIDAALSFLEDHEALLKQPEPVKEPTLDLSDLPF